MSRTLRTAALLATSLLVPLATAIPVPLGVDLAMLAPAPALGVPPPFPGSPGFALGTVTIDGVTADSATTGNLVGAGVVNGCGSGTGIGCVVVPAVHPLYGWPVSAMECQIVAVSATWAANGLDPVVHLAQDSDLDGVLDNNLGADRYAGGVGYSYGAPTGPIPAAWPAGAVGGAKIDPFAAIDPSLPVHLVLDHPGMPLSPVSALLSVAVTCWAV